METSSPFVEVYRCHNPLEADRAIVEVLEANGIESHRRDRMSSALPAPDTETGGYFIAVPNEQSGRARKLLTEALEDGALDDEDGAVVESDGN